MARRSLSMQGRILAAGVSVAVGGALVGIMASGDHGATATTTDSNTTSSASATAGDAGSSTAVPYDGRAGSTQDSGVGAAQPQTRTGGS